MEVLHQAGWKKGKAPAPDALTCEVLALLAKAQAFADILNEWCQDLTAMTRAWGGAPAVFVTARALGGVQGYMARAVRMVTGDPAGQQKLRKGLAHRVWPISSFSVRHGCGGCGGTIVARVAGERHKVW